MTSGIFLSPEYDQQIRGLIRQDRGTHRNVNESEGLQAKKLPSRFRTLAVILDEALPAPTSALEPTTAKATVLRWSVSNAKYTETEFQIDVFNHAESKAHAINTFGAAQPIDGHFWFFGDCEPMANRE